MATIQELTTRLNEALKLKAQIESLQQKLDAILGGAGSSSTPKKKVGNAPCPAATIEKMRAAQQARWAGIKGKSSTRASANVKASPATSSVKAAPKKEAMSPEAKAKIAAAMKARWAAKKKDAATE